MDEVVNKLLVPVAELVDAKISGAMKAVQRNLNSRMARFDTVYQDDEKRITVLEDAYTEQQERFDTVYQDDEKRITVLENAYTEQQERINRLIAALPKVRSEIYQYIHDNGVSKSTIAEFRKGYDECNTRITNLRAEVERFTDATSKNIDAMIQKFRLNVCPHCGSQTK